MTYNGINIRTVLKGTVNPEMILWFIAAFTAYFVKGLCGFANTLIFSTILSFGAANASTKVYLPLAILVLAGSIPGALILKNVDVRSIKLVFGFVVIALGMEMFTREFRKNRACASKLVLAIIGITAGMLCGLFGVGALLAAYVSRVTETNSSFKANISAVFIVDNTFRIILYKALGLLTLGTVKAVLLLIPFALLGLFTGMKCCGHMNEKNVRKITTVLLILSGISLVLKNL